MRHKNFCTQEKAVEKLAKIAHLLKNAASLEEKLDILNADPCVKIFLNRFQNHGFSLSLKEELVIKSLIVIGQAENLLSLPHAEEEAFRQLLEQLWTVEKFYKEAGGIVGYQSMILRLLEEAEKKEAEEGIYIQPEGLDISDEEKARETIVWGLVHMEELAEIYPLGGAADRLNLHDEKSGEPLPAARLLFGGKSLLEGMISDLQAREYLYYKLFGKQLETPIAIMTSQEKNNHAEIVRMLEEKKWFGRSQESFRLFCQPSVPTVNKEGIWCLRRPMQLFMKPGGHGVIWKLAQEEGIFEWLYSRGRKKALVRQINNPVAGVDYGLLSFTGLGCRKDKKFGFASCPRLVKSKEGTNVLIERKGKTGYEYVLTNIEYCDFNKFDLVDEPVEEGSPYSKFSSNTNLLFIDLKTLQEAVAKNPFPGRIINFRKAIYSTQTGEVREEEVARLESMMQNIADLFIETAPEPLPKGQRDQLKTFITFNRRRKTISTAKQAFIEGSSSLLETPEGCFFDHLQNVYELLHEKCGMALPSLEKFFKNEPPFLCFYHPALGPLYALIAQKIRGGRMGIGSELQLEIADLEMENLDLNGSLLIHAQAVMGHWEASGELRYSDRTGKCLLKNVTVRNRGIDRKAAQVYWKNEIAREESCQIVIEGDGEFYAENLTLSGEMQIHVEAGARVTACARNGQVVFEKEAIKRPSWTTEYRFDEKGKIYHTRLDF